MKILCVVILFSFIGCAEESVSVNWKTYMPLVKIEIDAAYADKKCNKMQKQFDLANLKSSWHRSKFGVSNVPLMDYIENKMILAGCYEL